VKRPQGDLIRLTGDGRFSELLAPNRPVRYAFQRQQSGVDFVYTSTRHRPIGDIEGMEWPPHSRRWSQRQRQLEFRWSNCPTLRIIHIIKPTFR
jgi:hypothetical protein